jgi:hypothetical protein
MGKYQDALDFLYKHGIDISFTCHDYIPNPFLSRDDEGLAKEVLKTERLVVEFGRKIDRVFLHPEISRIDGAQRAISVFAADYAKLFSGYKKLAEKARRDEKFEPAEKGFLIARYPVLLGQQTLFEMMLREVFSKEMSFLLQ